MIIYLVVLNVAIACGLLWIIFSGLGLAIRRCFGCDLSSASDLRLAPWVGWGGAIAILQFWHLVYPVNGAARILILLLGLVGWAWHARQAGTLLKTHARHALLVAIVFMIGALWVANHAVKQPGIYDSGLYHLNGIRWAKEYPVVPGLGNLHSRLAYNNSSFLYTALLDVGPFLHRSHHVTSAFLITLLLFRGVFAWGQLWRLRTAAPVSERFMALATVPLVVWTVNSGYTSSPSPDVPCFLLGLLLAGELLRMQDAPVGSGEPPHREAYGSLCLLAMIGITVKLSFVAYGVTAGAVAFLLHGLERRRPAAWLTGAAVTVALILLVLVPWSLRSIFVSGFPVYPSTVGRVPVDWAISEEAAIGMTRTILAWARAPGAPQETVLDTWSWFGPWFRRTLHDNAFDFTAPIITALVALAIAAWRLLRRTLPLRPRAWLCLVPALAGIAVWFHTAPDPRYQGAMLWILGLGALLFALEGAHKAASAFTLALPLLILISFARPLDMIRTWKNAEPVRRVPMQTKVTDSGLVVYVPVTGDQAWDSDIPATPYFSPRLHLRVPGEMAQGFNKQSESAPLQPLWKTLTGRTVAVPESDQP